MHLLESAVDSWLGTLPFWPRAQVWSDAPDPASVWVDVYTNIILWLCEKNDSATSSCQRESRLASEEIAFPKVYHCGNEVNSQLWHTWRKATHFNLDVVKGSTLSWMPLLGRLADNNRWWETRHHCIPLHPPPLTSFPYPIETELWPKSFV